MKTRTQKVAIVGTGIAGLTAAYILKQHGFRVTIFEQKPEFSHIGAGLILQSNAVSCLEKMGLKDTLQQGLHIKKMSLRTYKGKPLLEIKAKNQHKVYSFQRRIFAQALLHKLDDIEMHFDHKYIFSRDLDQGIQLGFSCDGEQKLLDYDFVIGADGQNSKIAEEHFSSRHTDLKFDCFRAVLDHHHNDHAIVEHWGKGCTLGYVPLKNDKVYIYLCKKNIGGKPFDFESIKEEFLSFPEVFHPFLKGEFLHHQIKDHETPQILSKRKILVIGDGAHSVSPYSGQGAGQAIEDTYNIHKLLEQGLDLQKTFELLPQIRGKRLQQIHKMGRQNTHMALMNNFIAESIRNVMVKMIAPFATLRLDKFYQVD